MAESQRYDIGHDTHYKKLVSTLGEKQNITTTGDIYSDQGQKLIAKGTKINERVSAQLLKHKLQSPLDDSLTIDEPVTVKTIVDDITELVESSKTLSSLYNNLTDTESIENYWKIDNFNKPLRGISSYKAKDLQDICKK